MSEASSTDPGRLPTGARLRLNLWLEGGEEKVLFGAGRMQILVAIRTHGSLSAAAEALGMSYRGLWAKIRHSERRLGFPLVESHAGRGPSSGTSLTPQAEALMAAYAQIEEQVSAEAARAFAEAFPDHEAPAG
jgi:molybdate transport system regulatory protein